MVWPTVNRSLGVRGSGGLVWRLRRLVHGSGMDVSGALRGMRPPGQLQREPSLSSPRDLRRCSMPPCCPSYPSCSSSIATTARAHLHLRCPVQADTRRRPLLLGSLQAEGLPTAARGCDAHSPPPRRPEPRPAAPSPAPRHPAAQQLQERKGPSRWLAVHQLPRRPALRRWGSLDQED